MPDWSASMQQTYEYYIVDPNTWGNKSLVTDIISCTVDRDEDNVTLGGATINCTNSIGEAYIRVYLVTIQNGIREKHVLGTFLVQTPATSFDGKSQSITLDAYTPLIELKENSPPLGYSLRSGEKVMPIASNLCRENMRAPVVASDDTTTLYSNFVASLNEKWITFIQDLITYANFKYDMDELGRLLFAPKQDVASLQPKWTYTDDNSSILHPSINVDRDLYGVPNVVEVIYSSGAGYLYAEVVNDDPNSPISTINRGRRITHRVTDPSISGTPTQAQIDEYATQLLRDLSALEYTLTYTHGYCPVRLGDCVRLNYKRAGINNVKAKVIRQSIQCVSGCPVEETAIFTTNLWG